MATTRRSASTPPDADPVEIGVRPVPEDKFRPRLPGYVIAYDDAGNSLGTGHCNPGDEPGEVLADVVFDRRGTFARFEWRVGQPVEVGGGGCTVAPPGVGLAIGQPIGVNPGIYVVISFFPAGRGRTSE